MTEEPNFDPESSDARRYLESVLAVVGDLEVDIEEVRRVRRERESLGLSKEVLRAVHARVFLIKLERYSEHNRIDDHEKENLRRLYQCLAALGWAPGE